MNRQPRASFASALAVAIPGVWLAVLLLLPLLILLGVSLFQAAPRQLPYTQLVTTPLYALALVKSIGIAAFATLVMLIAGYPIAHGIWCMPRRVQPLLTALVVAPFGVALLIRTYAWMNVLQPDGPLDRALMALHMVGAPPHWLGSDAAVFIGIVHAYLPLMVLSLHAALAKVDGSLVEAAIDLGCPRWRAFWFLTLPSSAPGVVVGALLCFIAAMGEFVVPDLLGSAEAPMIGQTVWIAFFGHGDWPMAAAVAVVLACLLVAPILALRAEAAQTPRGG